MEGDAVGVLQGARIRGEPESCMQGEPETARDGAGPSNEVAHETLSPHFAVWRIGQQDDALTPQPTRYPAPALLCKVDQSALEAHAAEDIVERTALCACARQVADHDVLRRPVQAERSLIAVIQRSAAGSIFEKVLDERPRALWKTQRCELLTKHGGTFRERCRISTFSQEISDNGWRARSSRRLAGPRRQGVECEREVRSERSVGQTCWGPAELEPLALNRGARERRNEEGSDDQDRLDAARAPDGHEQVIEARVLTQYRASLASSARGHAFVVSPARVRAAELGFDVHDIAHYVERLPSASKEVERRRDAELFEGVRHAMR